MKLETLNNEKFKLANTEMSKLVGARISITPTEGGAGYPTGTTSDKYYSYSGTDIVNGILSNDYYWSGANDVSIRDAFNPTQR